MRRRKPDSIELQQMKAQAHEEKVKRQMEKNRFLNEKELREEAEKEKNELEQRLLKYQEDAHGTQEALRRSEETAELLAEKARVAEEEAMLLSQKAAETEAEIQRIKINAIKTEEEKHLMQRKAEEAELIANTLVEERRHRAKEAEELREELYSAKVSEHQVKAKLLYLLKSLQSNSCANGSPVQSLHQPHHMHSASQKLSPNHGTFGESPPQANNITNCNVLVRGSSLNELSNSSKGVLQSVSQRNYSNLAMNPNQLMEYRTNENWSSMDQSRLHQMQYFQPNSNSPQSNSNCSADAMQNGDVNHILSASSCYGNNTSVHYNDSNNNSAMQFNQVSMLNAAAVSPDSSFTRSFPTLMNEAQTNGSDNSSVDHGLVDVNSHEFLISLTTSDLEKLEFEAEKERIEYLQKSKYLQEQLKDLKTEIQVLKVEDKLTDFDRIHDENVNRGETKYSTLKKTRSGTTNARVAFFEEL